MQGGWVLGLQFLGALETRNILFPSATPSRARDPIRLYFLSLPKPAESCPALVALPSPAELCPVLMTPALSRPCPDRFSTAPPCFALPSAVGSCPVLPGQAKPVHAPLNPACLLCLAQPYSTPPCPAQPCQPSLDIVQDHPSTTHDGRKPLF